MRRLLLLVVLLGTIAGYAGAAPLCVDGQSLAYYIANYGSQQSACQIGDKLFWGFSAAPGPQSWLYGQYHVGAEPDPADISVQTIPGDGVTNIGIAFTSGGWSISSGITIDQVVSYDVATVSGLPYIKDASLIVAGDSCATCTAQASEKLGTTTSASDIATLNAALPSPASSHVDLLTLRTGMAVTNEVLLIGGPQMDDLAHLSLLENDFSEITPIPEPMTALPVGAALLLAGRMLRRRIARIEEGGMK